MKLMFSEITAAALQDLSVSSNGSTWVKLVRRALTRLPLVTFSILERIDVGETSEHLSRTRA